MKLAKPRKQKMVWDMKHAVEESMLKEKIKLVRKQLAEFQDNPEEHSIEEMLIMNRKRKDFDNLNFLTGDAVKNFKNENQKVASFLQKSSSMVGSTTKKLWKPDKYNFNRKNAMCENIQKFAAQQANNKPDKSNF